MELVSGTISEVASGIGEATVQAAAPAVEAGVGTIANTLPNVGVETAGTMGEIANTAPETVAKEGMEAVANPLGDITEAVPVSGDVDAANSQTLSDVDTAGQNPIKETDNSASQNLKPDNVGADTNQTSVTKEGAKDQEDNKTVEEEKNWEKLTTEQKINRIWEKLKGNENQQDIKTLLKKMDEMQAQQKAEVSKRKEENEALKKQNEALAERQKLLEAQQKQLLLILADIDNKNKLSATPDSGT